MTSSKFAESSNKRGNCRESVKSEASKWGNLQQTYYCSYWFGVAADEEGVTTFGEEDNL